MLSIGILKALLSQRTTNVFYVGTMVGNETGAATAGVIINFRSEHVLEVRAV